MNNHLIHQISDISIHSAIMVIFLTLFFFTISIRLERHVASEQLKNLADTYINYYIIRLSIQNLTQEQKQLMIDKIKNRPINDDIKNENKKILIRGIIFITIVTVLTIVINIILYILSSNLDILKIIFNNLIAIMFVAVIEFIFIFFVGQNVNIIKTSKITNDISGVLKKYLSK
tara:strand:+ start:11471 stop:11992 length:522 start_codon:yes stop_codon:yes gene_type:complete